MKNDSVWKIITEYLGMRKTDAKTAKWWLEGAPQVGQDINERLQIESDLFFSIITADKTWIFLVRSESQAVERSVKVSDVSEVEESKIVKVRCQNRIDTVLRCEEHRPMRFLATGPDDQSASLQGDSAVYVSLST